MEISVSIICRDEEDFIVQCLDSIKGVGEEIVILDNGSTDTTIEKIKEWKHNNSDVKVKLHTEDIPVEDFGFSDTRNRCMALCSGKRIAIIDADEELETDASEMRELILRFDVDTIFTTHHKQVHKDGFEYAQLKQFRVFPNRKEVFYSGREHNQLCFRVERKVANEGYVMIDAVYNMKNEKMKSTNIMFVHMGHTTEKKEKARLDRTERHANRIIKELDEEGWTENKIEDMYNLGKMTMLLEGEGIIETKTLIEYYKKIYKVFVVCDNEWKWRYNRFCLLYVDVMMRNGNWDVYEMLEMHTDIKKDLTVDNCFYRFAWMYRHGRMISAFVYARRYLELIEIEQVSDPTNMQGTLVFVGYAKEKIGFLRKFLDRHMEM